MKEEEDEVVVVVEEENHHPTHALPVSILLSSLRPPFPSLPYSLTIPYFSIALTRLVPARQHTRYMRRTPAKSHQKATALHVSTSARVAGAGGARKAVMKSRLQRKNASQSMALAGREGGREGG